MTIEDTPESLHALYRRLVCPDCSQDLVSEIDGRTGVQNPRVLVCQSNGCKQHMKRWTAPTVELRPE